MPIPTKDRLRRAPILPPHPSFTLSELPDDALLTQIEVASVMRQTLSWTEKRRYAGNDGLTWTYIDGRPRCVARSLKARVAGVPNKGPQDAQLARKKTAPPIKTKPAKQRATAEGASAA